MHLAHVGTPAAPHDLAGAWSLDPWLVIGLAAIVWAYTAGNPTRSERIWVTWAMAVTLLAIASPLDAASGSLASAHMVQHVLLMVAVGPLLAAARPIHVTSTALPVEVRRRLGGLRRATGMTPSRMRRLIPPVALLLVFVLSTWSWHSAVLYGATLESETVHRLEHVAFVATAAGVWWAVTRSTAGRRADTGAGVLVLFAAMMSNVLLAALMTFARTPWYEGYAGTTGAWGLGHLADQQLAGVLMWVPTTAVFVLGALWLLRAFVTDGDPEPSRVR